MTIEPCFSLLNAINSNGSIICRQPAVTVTLQFELSHIWIDFLAIQSTTAFFVFLTFKFSSNQQINRLSKQVENCFFFMPEIWFKLAYQYVRLIDFSHLQSVRACAYGYALTIQLLTEFIKKQKCEEKNGNSQHQIYLLFSLIHLVFASNKLTMCQSQFSSFLETFGEILI